MVATAEESNDVAQQESFIKNVFCMEGGQGASSYLNNSHLQSRTIQLVLDVLKETLDKMIQHLPRLPEKKLLTVADLGCSCGKNALDVADAILQHVAEKCGAAAGGQQAAPPELCFYFSDLPSNDFNTPLPPPPGLPFHHRYREQWKKLPELLRRRCAWVLLRPAVPRKVHRRLHLHLVDAHVGRALGGEVFCRLERRAAERMEEMMVGLPYHVCSLSLA